MGDKGHEIKIMTLRPCCNCECSTSTTVFLDCNRRPGHSSYPHLCTGVYHGMNIADFWIEWSESSFLHKGPCMDSPAHLVHIRVWVNLILITNKQHRCNNGQNSQQVSASAISSTFGSNSTPESNSKFYNQYRSGSATVSSHDNASFDVSYWCFNYQCAASEIIDFRRCMKRSHIQTCYNQGHEDATPHNG